MFLVVPFQLHEQITVLQGIDPTIIRSLGLFATKVGACVCIFYIIRGKKCRFRSEITQDNVFGKLPYPCSNESHARFSYNNIYSMCHRAVHPTDSHAFPDQVNSIPVMAASLIIHNNLIPLEDRSLNVHEPFPCNLTASKGNVGCCEENMPLDMDMETELSIMPDQSNSITCRQSSTSMSLDGQQPAVHMVSCTGSFRFLSVCFFF